MERTKEQSALASEETLEEEQLASSDEAPAPSPHLRQALFGLSLSATAWAVFFVSAWALRTDNPYTPLPLWVVVVPAVVLLLGALGWGASLASLIKKRSALGIIGLMLPVPMVMLGLLVYFGR